MAGSAQQTVTVVPAAVAPTGDPANEDFVSPRSQRADARRNRELLVAAASAAFAERGVDTSLEEIARSAGVGIGTLYRHFPTRYDLVEAVYRNEVELLCGGIDELLAEQPADAALAAWMERFIRYVAVKRGLVGAMKAVVSADAEVFAYTHRLVTDTMGRLVAAAVADGSIRADADPGDLLRGLSGVCMVSDQEGWQERAVRLVALMMDGLRYGAPARS